jgi:hypothetical protein
MALWDCNADQLDACGPFPGIIPPPSLPPLPTQRSALTFRVGRTVYRLTVSQEALGVGSALDITVHRLLMSP